MNPTPSPTSENTSVKPATSVGQVFALVAGFLALAAIGATIGWTLTDTSSSTNNATGPSPSPSVVATTPATQPSTAPPPSVTPTGNLLPDFAAQKVAFKDALGVLTAAKVGWLVVFSSNDTGNNTVTATVPPAGTPLTAGMTVKVYVDELPPVDPIPDVVGVSDCKAAGKTVAAAGFSLSYPSGKSGTVLKEYPAPTATAHWNDVISLTCGKPGSGTTASPSPSAPTGVTPSSGSGN